jgi:hypothetical protein
VDDVGSGHLGHDHVEDDKADRPGPDSVEGCPAGLGLQYLEAGSAQGEGHETARGAIVVDDEHGWSGYGGDHSGSAAARREATAWRTVWSSWLEVTGFGTNVAPRAVTLSISSVSAVYPERSTTPISG